jgi:hypothetical protein
VEFSIGTTNPNKVRKIGSILFASGCTFKVAEPVDPEETEDNFEGNALLKASVYARHAGGLTISEDSGLIIPASTACPDRGRLASPTARLTRKADGSAIIGSPVRLAPTGIPPTMPWFWN